MSAAETFPVLDELRAAPSSEGLLVEAATLEGGVLRFGVHRLAVAAVAATLLDAARRVPPGDRSAPAARVALDAAGVALSEKGDVLLVLEAGGAALAYALSPSLAAELSRALGDAFRLQAEPDPTQPTRRRHDA
ncbi:MAG: hypothetical protein K2X11_17690 [Acetobacteraceae bacterium]|nr:hypothetical protein [Acetobacteraceae bacterium]